MIGTIGTRDQRKSPRYLFTEKVLVGRTGLARFLDGYVEDLSLTGCLLRFDTSPGVQIGTDIEICFQSRFLRFRTVGHVRRWVTTGNRIGVSFSRLSASQLGELQDFLNTLEIRHG